MTEVNTRTESYEDCGKYVGPIDTTTYHEIRVPVVLRSTNCTRLPAETTGRYWQPIQLDWAES
jgi:hypothetical protein